MTLTIYVLYDHKFRRLYTLHNKKLGFVPQNLGFCPKIDRTGPCPNMTSWMTLVRRDIRFDEEKAIRVSLETEIELHADEKLLAPKIEGPLIDVDIHKQRFRVWRHPLRQSLPEREESALERLTDCWLMHRRRRPCKYPLKGSLSYMWMRSF